MLPALREETRVVHKPRASRSAARALATVVDRARVAECVLIRLLCSVCKCAEKRNFTLPCRGDQARSGGQIQIAALA